MSLNYLIKTARHLAEMFLRYLKDGKSKQSQTKALIIHLKKTFQRHLRNVSKTLLR